jgi:Ala-tRNA(Pro) deacylase
MAIAITLRQYLEDHDVPYDVMVHKRTSTSWQTAHACQLSANCVAKAVALSREGGFVIAVIPANCRVEIDRIRRLVPGPVEMASEDEIEALFPDCEAGALPPIASAYGLDVVVDESLDALPDVYLEGGDHHSLIHMRGRDFRNLLQDAPRASIATQA